MTLRPREMDEFLERIWTQKEKGKEDLGELLALTPVKDGDKWIKHLCKDGLALVRNETVKLTKSGEKEAGQIIRRHRLTERLFADVFRTSEEVWEKEACALEHEAILVTEAVNSICAFLGHPPTCPHGRPIPRGSCCAEFRLEVKSFVIPLIEARLAETYRVVFVTPKNSGELDRLSVLGVVPGSEIRIRQKRPACVIRVGETDIALDEEVVRGIYVKNGGSGVYGGNS